MLTRGNSQLFAFEVFDIAADLAVQFNINVIFAQFGSEICNIGRQNP